MCLPVLRYRESVDLAYFVLMVREVFCRFQEIRIKSEGPLFCPGISPEIRMKSTNVDSRPGISPESRMKSANVGSRPGISPETRMKSTNFVSYPEISPEMRMGGTKQGRLALGFRSMALF